MPQKDIEEHAILDDPALAPGARTSTTRAFPSKEQRVKRSREHARAILLEAGHDPAIIEQEIDRFLAQPLLFDLPSFDALKTMDGCNGDIGGGS